MKGKLRIKEAFLSLLFVLTLTYYGLAGAIENSAQQHSGVEQAQIKEAGKNVPSFQQAPSAWLMRMEGASRNLSYRGVFVYQQGALLDTLAITHDAYNHQDKERIVYLDGLPREVVRNGKTLTYSTPNRGIIRFNNGSLMPMVKRFSNVLSDKNYQISYAAKHFFRIAGREAVVLSIIPTDHYRYGYQLWLDAKTALPLKSVMLGGNGSIIERMQFTHIEIGVRLTQAEMQAMDKSNDLSGKVINIEKSSKKGGVWNWEAGWIPSGFVVKSISERPSPVSNQKTDAVLYSDGIASFSIFVEPDETRVLSQSSENIGTLAAVSKIFRRGDTFFNVTVIGDVPLGTAERIAVSVRSRKNTATVDAVKE
ncbi:MAG: MucB/RseB C-terminal domain-containing protein [Endozoicomonas sp. (ex Botrylloides leachii)]|nr:MucB/RseB C-terminal domain-containing protein [Endozoicomonas sp. (ex Botrylloides leachii)]